jgi:hypothetical protein
MATSDKGRKSKKQIQSESQIAALARQVYAATATANRSQEQNQDKNVPVTVPVRNSDEQVVVSYSGAIEAVEQTINQLKSYIEPTRVGAVAGRPQSASSQGHNQNQGQQDGNGNIVEFAERVSYDPETNASYLYLRPPRGPVDPISDKPNTKLRKSRTGNNGSLAKDIQPGVSPEYQNRNDITAEPLYVNPVDEYVSGGKYGWSGQLYRTLPQGVDELERDFPDIYDKMMLDAKVKQSVMILKLGVLSQGFELVSKIQDERHEDYEIAKEITAFCQRNLDNLQTPIMSLLFEVMDAVIYGHTVAEQTYEYAEEGPDKGFLVLKSIKIKPRGTTALVVDPYYNVLGVTALNRYYDPSKIQSLKAQGFDVYREPNPSPPLDESYDANGQPLRAKINSAKNSLKYQSNKQGWVTTGPLFPRSKFLIFAPFKRDGDPRGQSFLRGAYTAWWMKTQSYPEYIRYLAQFATPILVGYTAPNAQIKYQNPDGTFVSPEKVMLNALVQARNGVAMAFPHGSEVQAITTGNGGTTFLDAGRQFDEQISYAILLQHLASGEGLHQTRASSTVHKSLLSMLIRWVQDELGAAIRNDVLKTLIGLNFPGGVERYLTPTVQIGSVQVEDFSSMATAVSTLFEKGYLHPSQIDELDAMMGLPRRPFPPTQPAPQGQGQGGGAAPGAPGQAQSQGTPAPGQPISGGSKESITPTGDLRYHGMEMEGVPGGEYGFTNDMSISDQLDLAIEHMTADLPWLSSEAQTALKARLKGVQVAKPLLDGDAFDAASREQIKQREAQTSAKLQNQSSVLAAARTAQEETNQALETLDARTAQTAITSSENAARNELATETTDTVTDTEPTTAPNAITTPETEANSGNVSNDQNVLENSATGTEVETNLLATDSENVTIEADVPATDDTAITAQEQDAKQELAAETSGTETQNQNEVNNGRGRKRQQG